MGKKLFSLCMALVLCLSLLPVTALAAEGAPGSLYVAGQQITDEGYYTQSGGNWTKSGDASTPPSAPYFHYTKGNDNTPATLTLSGATIQRGTSTGTVPYGAGIYAQCSNGQSVTLTIKLIGENTITGYYGIYVNAEISAVSNGTDASLTITSENNGSLEVSGSNHGIFVKSGTGNASLNIEKATVTSSTDGEYAAGVNVQSSANVTGSPNISLSVNGGSLTASGTGNSDGILFHVGQSQATGATTSLTITDHAIVDARNGGISASRISETLPTPTPTSNNSSGIVFDGSTGTVYGSVTLQENLTIGEGERLKLADNNASLSAGGHDVIVDGGTLDEGLVEDLGNSVIYKVTQVELDKTSLTLDVNESETLTATITPGNATNQTVTWESNAPSVAMVDTNGKVTAVGEGTATITATAADGSGEKATCSVTVDAAATVPVESVSLDKTSLELTEGETAQLNATVLPSNATNRAVNWTSSDSTVATVDQNGNVEAVGAGAATITVTTVDQSKTATCTVTVTKSTYIISADTTALDFGSAYTGYTQPAAKTVTITNDGNQTLTLNQPASTVSFEVGTLTKTQLAAGEKATFTVQPKAGLAVGTYSENFTVSGDGGATVTITANFTVQRYSSGGGTPTKTPSQQAVDKIESAKDGSTVEIKLSTGSTKLDKEVFEELAGRDVTLEISLSNGVTWTVNGQDIPKNAKLSDLDLGVSLNTSTIPVSVINTITGTVDTIQLSLKHDGEFGFTMTLTAPLGKTNAGYWANLYYYNTRTRTLEFQSASKIATDGTASFPFSHASDYAIVIDTDSHEPVELPFTDVPEDAWYEDAAGYVYKHGLMAGTSATTFAPDVTTSRAMIATILWRMAGSPVVDYAMTYTDVAQGQWYSEAVRWATSEGVVTGYGNGLFGTNDPITREQLATMLWRYAQTEDYDVSVGEDTNILSYTDAFDVAEYAIPAMQWAVGAGVINGTSDGSTLTPQGQATRAQAAVMLMRFCENYVTW